MRESQAQRNRRDRAWRFFDCLSGIRVFFEVDLKAVWGPFSHQIDFDHAKTRRKYDD